MDKLYDGDTVYVGDRVVKVNGTNYRAHKTYKAPVNEYKPEYQITDTKEYYKWSNDNYVQDDTPLTDIDPGQYQCEGSVCTTQHAHDYDAFIARVRLKDEFGKDYIREMKAMGVPPTTRGLAAHRLGSLIEKFKADHPKMSGAIKGAVDVVNDAAGIVHRGVMYVLHPVKGVWEVYSKVVNEYLVPDAFNEWILKKGGEFEDYYGEWKSSLTDKQLALFNAGVDVLEVSTNATSMTLGAKTIAKTKLGKSIKIKEWKHVNDNINTGIKQFVEVDANLLKKEINLTPKKLQMKFKHAKHFGMEGMNYNKKNADLFRIKILEHIKNPDTVVIAGKYRGDKAVHYFNPKTDRNIMKDLNGNFISGWKLEGDQLENFLKGGYVE